VLGFELELGLGFILVYLPRPEIAHFHPNITSLLVGDVWSAVQKAILSTSEVLSLPSPAHGERVREHIGKWLKDTGTDLKRVPLAIFGLIRASERIMTGMSHRKPFFEEALSESPPVI